MTNDELVRMWNEGLMALFDIISQPMPGWIKKIFSHNSGVSGP
jgi:hypothetical protein